MPSNTFVVSGKVGSGDHRCQDTLGTLLYFTYNLIINSVSSIIDACSVTPGDHFHADVGGMMLVNWQASAILARGSDLGVS